MQLRAKITGKLKTKQRANGSGRKVKGSRKDASSPFLRWCRDEHNKLIDEFYVGGNLIDTRQRILDKEIEAKHQKLKSVEEVDTSASAESDGNNTLFSNCSNENCQEPRLCKILSKGEPCKFLIRAPRVRTGKSKSPYKLRPRRRLSYGESSCDSSCGCHDSASASADCSSCHFAYIPGGVTPLKNIPQSENVPPVSSSPATGGRPSSVGKNRKTIPQPPPKLTLSTIKKPALRRQRGLSNVTNISLQVFTGAESELLESSSSGLSTVAETEPSSSASPRLRRVDSSSPRDPRMNLWLLNNGLNLSEDLSSINKTQSQMPKTRRTTLAPGDFSRLLLSAAESGSTSQRITNKSRKDSKRSLWLFDSFSVVVLLLTSVLLWFL